MKRKPVLLLRKLSALHGSADDRMKRPIALLTLLLACPSLASAQETFNATSGSFVLGYQDLTAPFTVAGPGFSSSGSHSFHGIFPNPLNFPFSSGGAIALNIPGSTSDFNLTMNLSVHGVPWGLPQLHDANGGSALSIFSGGPVLFSGPGVFSGTFTYSGFFMGVPLSVISANPGKDCAQLMCPLIVIDGGGTVTYDVVPFPNFPGELEIKTATFTFKAPEPSALALLLLGLAGLAVMGRRRRFRTMSHPAG